MDSGFQRAGEDMQMAEVLLKVGKVPGSSVDAQGRESWCGEAAIGIGVLGKGGSMLGWMGGYCGTKGCRNVTFH